MSHIQRERMPVEETARRDLAAITWMVEAFAFYDRLRRLGRDHADAMETLAQDLDMPPVSWPGHRRAPPYAKELQAEACQLIRRDNPWIGTARSDHPPLGEASLGRLLGALAGRHNGGATAAANLYKEILE